MKTKFNYTSIENNNLLRTYFPIFDELENDIIFTFSGKTAISLLLRYFRSIGILENKMDQILVSPWLGYWVYMTMTKFCFPTIVFNPQIKGVFVYHQWGFPQKINEIKKFCEENDLFIIEDCAHSFESFIDGARVGTFGDAAVFSLAKFFPCVVGGAVYSKDPEIKKFVNNLMQTAPKNMQLSREIFKNRIQVDAHPSKKNLIKLEQGYAIYDHIFNIRSYSLAVVRRQMKDMALDQRRHHLETIYNEFKNYDYIEILPNEGISPYMFPLFFEEKICKRIVTLLNENGIESNIYNFDINRNILNPDFKKCVALPCHQGISSVEMDQTVSLVKQGISG